MEKALPSPDISPRPGLDAFQDARAIVRLTQCSICSLPLRSPRTLPCGNSLCHKCMPECYVRQNISYPSAAGRREGFSCPFPDCGKEHPAADCNLDVTLAKVMEIVDKELGSQTQFTEDTALEVVVNVDCAGGYEERRRRMYGGRLAAIYALSKRGELYYDEDVTCASLLGDNFGSSYLDYDALERLMDKTRADLECQVCYGMLLDPVTTYCGHTFCRGCLERVLDHSRHCPSCRRLVHLPSVLPAQSSNKRLTELLVGLCPEALSQRAMAGAMESMAGSGDGGLLTPIFVCTASYPGMPTPLHIFEPRYRLMVRRACESGARKFGMLLPNRTGVPQGDLGVTPFMQYGTMLQIEEINMYPDGRSDVWTVGVSRFRVKRWGIRDEYIVADVERVDDIPIIEEEAIEALETALCLSSAQEAHAPWMGLPTQTLLHIGHQFVDQMQAVSAPWLHENNILAFGQRPDDPALFPYWLASVLPVTETEKYRLLCSTSVRERLQIVVGWIKRIETHRWFSASNCVII
ncbi:hypothetical protein C7212DRAFT_296354 [Tuber magnatum]|uniref:LON-domain-containing protein n=1 Tax=Tuber magnatum TaxID=42249 RepID=A0A317SMB8_9PEZI|nr:hypothetical protein C7212DRAFT_296354 [Tuber magnatum]